VHFLLTFTQCFTLYFTLKAEYRNASTLKLSMCARNGLVD